MNIKFEIFALTKKDAKTISDELNRVPVSYNQFFSPFDFNLEVIEKILDNAIQDSYYGIKIGNDFAGFYMIRGLWHLQGAERIPGHDSFPRSAVARIPAEHQGIADGSRPETRHSRGENHQPRPRIA